MGRVCAITNQKGGVGKTTTAVNLGAALASLGRHVLLIDIDPQANATSSLGIDKYAANLSTYDVLVDDRPLDEVVRSTPQQSLDLMPASPDLAGAEVELAAMMNREGRLRHAIEGYRHAFDTILIDCPPSLGLLTVNALTAADEVIVPVQCEYLALEGLSLLTRTIDLVRRHLNPGLQLAGLVMTMHDARTNLAQQVVEEVRQHFPDKCFNTIIPRSIRLSEAPSYGETILAYAPNSTGAVAYRLLAQEIVQHVEGET
ncbi:MAG: Sporulation initiation inhibitor protein Soj [Anaerolineales bacterium]|nr:Sporulation initiation inhibitor protein Soj [Anaerolineales bacterium]